MLALQGCAVSQYTSGFSNLGSRWLGSSKKKDAARGAEVTEERLLAAAKLDPQGVPHMATLAKGCPKFVVWPRDRHFTVYEKGRNNDGLAIIYRSEISKTARECELGTGLMTIKYGLAGRVLLGPKGKPGTFKVPVLLHLNDKKNNKITTERHIIEVSVTADKPVGYFSLVRRISFDFPSGAAPKQYELNVAFEARPYDGS